MKRLLTLTALGAVLVAASNANAAGFFIKEQSVSSMGNAFAGGTAGAEDISYSFWNVAGLTRHKGTQVNGNLTLLHSTIEATSENTPYNTEDSVIPFAGIPSFYASHQIDDKFTAGFSITAPFGLVSDYENDFTPVPLPYAQDTLSDLVTYNIASSIAYKATDKLSLGVGLNIQHISAHLESSISGGAAVQKFEGDTTDIGYTLGALYEMTDKTRFGVAYRSQVKHKLKGSGEGPSTNEDIYAKLTTPEVLTFGAYHELNDKWAVMAEAQNTAWSAFQSLDIVDDNGKIFHTPENWKDVWFYSVGANYKLDDKTKLRFGVAYDNNPTSDAYRTMRIPDSDRIWLSTGVGYEVDENMTLNVGYTFIHAEKADVHHTTPKIDTEYGGNIHLLGFGLNYNF